MKSLIASPATRPGVRLTKVSPDSERDSSPATEQPKLEDTPSRLLAPVNEDCAAARRQALEYCKKKNEIARRNK